MLETTTHQETQSWYLDHVGRYVHFIRKQHPSRPELPSFYSELGLWLIQHDGRWTIYTEQNGWSGGSTPCRCFSRLFNILQSEVIGPWTEDAKRQSAAELLADLEATACPAL
jgi:hypothetical protein